MPHLLPTLIWAGWIGIFAVVEGPSIALRKWNFTLSDTLRSWLHTNTKVGRYAWLGGWLLFSGWFAWHIGFVGNGHVGG